MRTWKMKASIQMLLREATSASGGGKKKSKDRIIKSKAVGTKMFVGVLFSEYLYEKGNRTEGKYTPNMNSWFVKRKHQPTNQAANTLEILRFT